jgi:hypothetical protein
MVIAIEADSIIQANSGDRVIKTNKFGQSDGRTMAGERARNVLGETQIRQILTVDPVTLSAGALLTRLRIENGVNLEILAQMSGLNPLTLSRAERGAEGRYPLLKKDIARITLVLGLSDDNPVAKLLIEKSPVRRPRSFSRRSFVMERF